nr:hypothetical protein [Tanacetum cinerariifolium]
MYYCELCGNDAHYGYDCPPHVSFVYNQDPCFNQDFDNNFPQTSPSFPQQYLCCDNCGGPHATFQCQPMNQNFYNSNSFGFDQFQPPQYPVIHHPPQESSVEILQARENLMQSIQTFLRKFNRISFRETPKSSVENLIPIPSESEGIFDDTCDVPFCDNSPPLDILNDHFELFSDFNDDSTLSNDDSLKDIDYVEASPPDSELVSLEEVKDDILHEKLLNINLLIAKIESLNDNSTPDSVLKFTSLFPIPVEDSDSFFEKSDTSLSYSDNSLPEFETFNNHTEETSSGRTTTHANNSLPEYDSFLFEIEPDQGALTSVVMEDIFREPHVHNVLPTHPTLMLDSDFIPSDDSIGSDLEVSFPFETRNKIFDPGIFFEVQSKRFLSPDIFSISFIHNLLCPLRGTLLPFSFEIKDKVFNLGILSSNFLSHQGKITFDFSESLMMISGRDIPFLDDLFLHFYPP